MKKLLFSILLISALFSRELPFPWVVYEDQIRYYLDGRSYEIDGKFYSYDFDNNGKIDYNDWIYISKNGLIYRLHSVDSTYNNRFGWQEIELPQDFQTKGEFQGYFIYLNYPNDKDKRYSWIFVNKEKKLFKLLPNRSWSFKWLPIPTDNLQISLNDNSITFSLLPISTISLDDAETTNYQDLEEIDTHSLNNLFLGYQKAQGVWLNFFSQPLDYRKDPFQTLEKFKKEIDNYFSTPQSSQTILYQLFNNGYFIIDNDNSSLRFRFSFPKPHPLEKYSISRIFITKNNIVVFHAGGLFFNLINTYRGCIITLSGYIPDISGSNELLENTKLELFCRIYKER